MKCQNLSWLLILSVGGGLTGCTSVKSTYFYRNDDDTGWKKKHSKGIPITLDVPTHVRFNVIQRYLLVNGRPLKIPNPTGAGGEVVYAARDVRYDLITEKKIFTVDMKRPAAGPYQNASTFENQYFSKIDHRLEDKTIETVGAQVNALVGKLLPTGAVASGKAQSTDFTNTNMIPLESVVCSEVFKLDAPDFEAQVAAFFQANCGPMIGVPIDGSDGNRVIATLPANTPGGGGTTGAGGRSVGRSGVDGRSGSPGPVEASAVGGAPPNLGTAGPNAPAAPIPPAAPNPAEASAAAAALKPQGRIALSAVSPPQISTNHSPVLSSRAMKSPGADYSTTKSLDLATMKARLPEGSASKAVNNASPSIRPR